MQDVYMASMMSQLVGGELTTLYFRVTLQEVLQVWYYGPGLVGGKVIDLSRKLISIFFFSWLGVQLPFQPLWLYSFANTTFSVTQFHSSITDSEYKDAWLLTVLRKSNGGCSALNRRCIPPHLRLRAMVEEWWK